MSFLKIPKVFAQTPEEIVGSINVPKGVDLYNADAGGQIGVIVFISYMTRAVIIVGGIFTILNLVFAAFAYITGGGKADTHAKVRDRFTMSVMGIMLMISSYLIAALIGLVFYGDASFILTPTITPIGQ